MVMRARATDGVRSRSGDRVAPVDPDVAALELSHPAAQDPHRTGAKAAALAKAHRLGLPVLPGFAVTTGAVAHLLERGRFTESAGARVRQAWASLSHRGARSLVVRSSSVAEDGTSQSMAGMFTSVTNVMGLEAFLEALQVVAASSRRPGAAGDGAPMAILVQPFLPAEVGGVLFGVDPVTGSRERLVVAAVEGPPEHLVSGTVQGSRYVLRKNGRVVETEVGSGGAALGGARRRALAGLAQHAQRAFGSPQDIEWAIDGEGKLWLLQSRPVTATGGDQRPIGPVLGPGPVAETFPDQLSLLEEDLWVEPLREALRVALSLVRAAPKKRIASSPIIASFEGRVAADLDLLGERPGRRSIWKRLDPRPPTRRLLASWDVGRLRAALPQLAARLVAVVDDELAKLPPLSEMTDPALADLLVRTRASLVALNGHEVLAGMLMGPGASAPSGAARGLAALARAREEELDDSEIVARHPEVLSLIPPAVGGKVELPQTVAAPAGPSGPVDPLAEAREECRMRARWLYELSARVAEEIGSRFHRAGLLQATSNITLLRTSEIHTMVATGAYPPELDRRGARPPVAPLPAVFRRTAEGGVVATEVADSSGGRGAGGGRGKGRVVHDATTAHPGDVLVVPTLDPDLATVLPGLGGLVAETGSVLSHLAILAREFGVPIVVGVAGARERFDQDTEIVVDGSTGEVSLIDESARREA